MSTKNASSALSTAALLAASCVAAHAETPTAANPSVPAPKPKLSPTEQTIQDLKNPTPWLNWGMDLRVRNEYLENARSLDSSSPYADLDWVRFRGRVWLNLTPIKDVTVSGRLTAEPRYYVLDASKVQTQGMAWTEGIVDNLYLKWQNALSQPATFTFGRQDIRFDDGWLTGDGTPLDGSRTYFLDSMRLACTLAEQHTTLEGVGILQYANNNQWIPTFPDTEKPLTDQNERGAMLRVTNKSLPNTEITGYFIYKHDEIIDWAKVRGDDADLYTVGAHVSGSFAGNWQYYAEGAFQFGSKYDPSIRAPFTDGAESLCAFGVNSRLSYLLRDSLSNTAMFSYEFLSGDNPETRGQDEMFDVLWGRWPRYSELSTYQYTLETRVGQFANLHRFGPGWSLSPLKGMTAFANYYVLLAQQEIPTRALDPALFTNEHIFRGQMLQFNVKQVFNPHVNAHLVTEVQFRGDYYADTAPLLFVRGEVYFTF